MIRQLNPACCAWHGQETKVKLSLRNKWHGRWRIPALGKSFFTKGAETGQEYQTLYGISLHSQRQFPKQNWSGSHRFVGGWSKAAAKGMTSCVLPLSPSLKPHLLPPQRQLLSLRDREPTGGVLLLFVRRQQTPASNGGN